MRRLAPLLPLLFATLNLNAAPRELDWLELMPAEDRQALEEMPEISHEGPEEDGDFSTKNGLRQRSKDLPAVMYSARTVAALNGKEIRLGGYPVPLETDAGGLSTVFFLVPYPGACIHVPPPPPNQIVLVRYPAGIRLEDIYAPLWVDGKLEVEKASNALADSAYTIKAGDVEPIGEEDL